MWGTFSPPNAQEAFEMFQRGMHLYKDPPCSIAVAECLFEGCGVDAPDFDGGLQILREVAENEAKSGGWGGMLRLGCTLVGGVVNQRLEEMFTEAATRAAAIASDAKGYTWGDESMLKDLSSDEVMEILEGVAWLERGLEKFDEKEGKEQGGKDEEEVCDEDDDSLWCVEGLYLMGVVCQYGLPDGTFKVSLIIIVTFSTITAPSLSTAPALLLFPLPLYEYLHQSFIYLGPQKVTRVLQTFSPTKPQQSTDHPRIHLRDGHPFQHPRNGNPPQQIDFMVSESGFQSPRSAGWVRVVEVVQNRV
jgi:hypothetical protein